jgi:CheY-like chemotaxis protein
MAQGILIAEDVKSTRMVMRRVLERICKDTPIDEAEDGEQVLEMYFAQQPNLIFLDVHLPKINGWGILSYIRRVDQKTKIVLVTASKEPEDVLKALELGADGFMGKPFDTEELTELLRRVGAS